MDEHGGHQDLRGSGYRSVIPYIHGRIEMYCSSLSCLSLPFRPPLLRLPELFIAQGRAVTLRPGAQQVAPRWLKPYTISRVLIARSSKWCPQRCGHAWSYRLPPCCTEHGQCCGAILSGCITTVAMSRSGQLGRRCTIELHCSGLHVCRRYSNAWACLKNMWA
jgi:hypothetical protein